VSPPAGKGRGEEDEPDPPSSSIFHAGGGAWRRRVATVFWCRKPSQQFPGFLGGYYVIFLF